MHSSSPTSSALTPPYFSIAEHSGFKTGNCHFKNCCGLSVMLTNNSLLRERSDQCKVMVGGASAYQPEPSDSALVSVWDDAWCWFKETVFTVGKVCASPTLLQPPPWKNSCTKWGRGPQLQGRLGLVAAIFRESHTFAVTNPAWLSCALSDPDPHDWQSHRAAAWVLYWHINRHQAARFWL